MKDREVEGSNLSRNHEFIYKNTNTLVETNELLISSAE
jgi:hypothetical protein